MSLDLETGSLLGFGSDWTTVGLFETAILAEIGTGQLGRSAPVKYWSCWLGDSRDGALKNGSLVSLRCLLFLLLVRPSSVRTWYDLTSTSLSSVASSPSLRISVRFYKHYNCRLQFTQLFCTPVVVVSLFSLPLFQLVRDTLTCFRNK